MKFNKNKIYYRVCFSLTITLLFLWPLFSFAQQIILQEPVSFCINSKGQVNLSWTPNISGNLDGIKYYLLKKPSDEATTSIETFSETFYQDKNIVSDKSYLYQIKGEKEGVFYYSNLVNVLPLYCPAEFSLLPETFCQDDGPHIFLNWHLASGNVLKYEIYRNNEKIIQTTNNNFDDNQSLGLEGKKTYNYFIKTIWQNKEANSVSINVEVPACPPKLNLTFACNSNLPGGPRIDLSWNYLSGVKEYKIYRKAPNETQFSLLKTLNGTNYIDNLVESLPDSYEKGGNIFYYLQANWEEDQKNSQIISITILSCPPFLKGESICNFSETLLPVVKLSWTKSLGATHYNIYRNNNFIYQTTKSDYIDYLSNENCPEKKCIHNYKIEALLIGNFFNSNEISKKIDCGTIQPPSPPVLTKALAFCAEGYSKISISWTNSDNITYYSLYRNNEEIIKTVNTSFEDQVQSSYQYNYYVRAFGIGGIYTDSLNSQTVFSLNCSQPSASILTLKTDCERGQPIVDLSWTESSNTLSYEIWRGSSPTNLFQLITFTKDSIEYSLRKWKDTNVATSTNYYYRVVSKGPIGVTPTNSNIVSIITYSCLPNVPSLTLSPTCVSGNPVVNLSWIDGGLNTAYYKIFRQDYLNGSEPYQIVFNPRITNWQDTNILPEISYSYKVEAIGFLGNIISSGWRQTRSLNCSLPESFNLQEPNVYCQGYYPKVNLSWSNSSNAISYDLFRLLNNHFTFSGLISNSFDDRGFGSALLFDGSNDYVNIPNSSSLQLTGNLTISFWAYPTNISKGRQNPLGKAYGGEFNLTIETNGSLSYYQGSARGNSSPYMSCSVSEMFSNNTWVNVIIVRDVNNRTIRFYKNGLLKTSSCGSWVAPSASTRNLRIGYEYAGYFAGIIDEVLIYNVALDSAAVSRIYEGNPIENNLVGYWLFNEKEGQIISDSSNFANNGTRGPSLNPEVNDPSWIENGLQWQKDYRWQVRANSYGGSTLSNLTNIYNMPVCSPSKPGLVLTSFCHSGLPNVRLSWSFTTQTERYEIYRQDKGLIKTINKGDLAFNNRIFIDNNDGLGLLEDKNYSYFLKVIGPTGLENQSDIISLVTPSCKIPLPPENLRANFICCSRSDGGNCGTSTLYHYPAVNLSWSASEGATSYLIYKKINSGNYFFLASTSSTNYFDFYPLVNVNTQYSYYVIASSAGGNSASSTPVEIRTGYCRISNSSIISLNTNCENNLPFNNITWLDNTPFNTLKYEVYRNTSYVIPDTPIKIINSFDPEFFSRNWKDSFNLNNSTKYYYWIKTIGSFEATTSPSKDITTFLCDVSLITSPELNLSSASCENNIPRPTFFWNNIYGAQSYNLYRINPDNSQSVYSTRSYPFVDRGNFALAFDGQDDYVRLSEPLTLVDFSIEFWANIGTKTSGWRTFLGDTGSGWELNLNSGNYYINAYSQGQLRSTFQLIPGQWYHIVLTRDHQGTKLYLNGSLNSFNTNTSTINNITFQIGRWRNSQYYQGLIDEVRIYDRALSPTEVSEHYQGIYKNEAGLKVVLHFDEGKGTIVFDESGNNNNGILYNGVERKAALSDWPKPLNISSVNNFQTYRYKIKAVGINKESDFSNEVLFYKNCFPARPDLKVIPRCFEGKSQIYLDWSEDLNTNYWRIYKKRKGELFSFLGEVFPPKSDFIDKNVETGIDYEYYLTAFGFAPEISTTSYSISTTTIFCYGGVPKPEIINATSSCFGYLTNNKIEWKKDESGQTIFYNIWRKNITQNEDDFKEIFSNLSASKNIYFDSVGEAGEGQKFIYKIEAVGFGLDNKIFSEQSNEITSWECSFMPPYSFSLKLNYSRAIDHIAVVSIGWTDAGNEEGYKVFRKLANEEKFAENKPFSFWKKFFHLIFGKISMADYQSPLVSLEADVLNYLDYLTEEDQSYHYQILAFNRNGSTLSNMIEAYVPVALPGNFTLSGSRTGDKTVYLYWEESLSSLKGGTVYYTIKKSYTNDFNSSTTVDGCLNITDRECIDEDIPFFATVYYKAIAKNNGGETESNIVRISSLIPIWTEVAP